MRERVPAPGGRRLMAPMGSPSRISGTASTLRKLAAMACSVVA